MSPATAISIWSISRRRPRGSTSAPRDAGWEGFRPFRSLPVQRLGRSQSPLRRSHRRRHRRCAGHRRRRLHLAPVAAAGRLRRRPARARAAGRGGRGRASCSPTGPSRSTSPTCPATACPTSCASATARSATGRTSATAGSAPRSTMDNAPWFDDARSVRPEAHPPRRYRRLRHDRHPLSRRATASASTSTRPATAGAPRRHLRQFPASTTSASITVADLLGRGTACLLWSSPLPRAAGRQLRYVDLMCGQKPHLLTGVVNNLGAETRDRLCARRRSSIWPTKRLARRGSRGCRSRSTWSSASRPATV